MMASVSWRWWYAQVPVVRRGRKIGEKSQAQALGIALAEALKKGM